MEDFGQYIGKVVHKDFSAGYVLLSYIVSYIGSWTTLELINRRTAGRGLYNWYLLIASSISMGGIAIWCMHFLGNCALILSYPPHKDDFIQIAYSPGFTAISFFIPILVLFVAFYAVGSQDSVSLIRVNLGGALAGLAICGMHYLGQFGITNYSCIYQIGNVVGSAVVAIAASIAALTVFFYLRTTWTNSWWKRGLTSFILAGAVSGMHWLASVGTNYELRDSNGGAGSLPMSNTVIVVIILSVSSCVILLCFTLVAKRRRSRSANRAQQVVLAAAVFDLQGKLMVTPEGLLPCQKITKSYVERSFEDVFGISHPVFLWIFRTSRNWAAVSSLLPFMRNHIQHTSLRNGSRSRTKLGEFDLTSDDGEPIKDYALLFRELFCVAAEELADQMHEPIEKIGFIFDEILSTGQMTTAKSKWKLSEEDSIDLERGGISPILFGRGQFLFVVRKADKREVERLQAAGFRFASISNVVDIISTSMQISSHELTPRLKRMNEYSTTSHVLRPGTHIACFVIRAVVKGWFDILVPKSARNQLPTMQLPIEVLEAWHLDFIRQFDGATVAFCVKSLRAKAVAKSVAKGQQLFASQLLGTIEALRDGIDDPIFLDATLIAEPVLAPCGGFGEDGKPSMAQIIAFRLIAPIHWRPPAHRLEFIPLAFFTTQQRVYKNSPDHELFARQVKREFGPILDQACYSPGGRDRKKSIPRMVTPGHLAETVIQSASLMPPSPGSEQTWKLWRKSAPALDERDLSYKNSDTGSMRDHVELVEVSCRQDGSIDACTPGSEPHVRPTTPRNARNDETQELELSEIKSSTRSQESRGAGTPIRLSAKTEVATDFEDPETYVDKLFAVCIETR